MKLYSVYGTVAERTNSFNTLCGSSANEAPLYQPSTSCVSAFNTLCGSSANEATFTAKRHTTKLKTFNTLCGSSANEAIDHYWNAVYAPPFQYPLRVVSQ